MASTSAAAAEVSGVAALLVGSGRAGSPAEIRAALLSSARDLGPRGHDPEHGAGLVQAWCALFITRAASAAVSTRTRAPGPSPAPWRNVWLTLSIAGAGLVVLVLVTRRRRGDAA